MDMYRNYGTLCASVDKHLFRALTQFWNPAYRQGLLESGKYANLFKEADEYNRDE
ncbi:hypothetical protein Gotur_028982 [Gossypium turneri]